MEQVSAAESQAGSWLRPGVARALEAQVIPRLVARHRPEPLQVVTPSGARWLAGLALADDDTALWHALIQLQQQGMAVEALQLDWLGPAAAELGRQWNTDECSFSDVTIGMVRLQCAARRLGRSEAAPAWLDTSPRAPRVLLAPVPGEQHGFGLALVADAFRRAGWDVTPVPPDASLIACVAAQCYDLVGLSVGSTARAPGVPSLCADLRRASRQRELGVLLGGPLFAIPGVPVLAAPWGADAVALDAREAVARAAAWMTWRGGLPGAPAGVQNAAVG